MAEMDENLANYSKIYDSILKEINQQNVNDPAQSYDDMFNPEKEYHELLDKVVDKSFEKMNCISKTNKIFRIIFVSFILTLLISETIVLLVFLAKKLLTAGAIIASFSSLTMQLFI